VENMKKINKEAEIKDLSAREETSEIKDFIGREKIPEIKDFDPLKGVRVFHSNKFGEHEFTFPANRNLTEKAKEMAKNMTKAEQIMWFQVLKSKKTNFKWLKQKIIDNYIVDFYCHTLGLVIEIDGNSHNERKEYDKIRTEFLNHFGLKVLRYSNNQVYNNLNFVKNDLFEKIQQRQKELQQLPLSRGQNA
jgi:very-short-patch-repair endonuclease